MGTGANKIRLNLQALDGTLLDAQVASTASITESKLWFLSSGGHVHDGTTGVAGGTLITTVNPSAVRTNIIHNEIPSGTVNGTNSLFTLSILTATSTYVNLYWNGQRMFQGVATATPRDYMHTSGILTTSFAAASTDTLLVDYIK